MIPNSQGVELQSYDQGGYGGDFYGNDQGNVDYASGGYDAGYGASEGGYSENYDSGTGDGGYSQNYDSGYSYDG